MSCPRCQGLIVDDWGDVKCCNCGFRLTSAYVPPAIDRMRADRAALAHDEKANLAWSLKNRKKRGKDKQPRRTHV